MIWKRPHITETIRCRSAYVLALCCGAAGVKITDAWVKGRSRGVYAVRIAHAVFCRQLGMSNTEIASGYLVLNMPAVPDRCAAYTDPDTAPEVRSEAKMILESRALRGYAECPPSADDVVLWMNTYAPPMWPRGDG